MKCDHDLAERETACADGMCPECLHMELICTRGLALAMYRFVPEGELKQLIWEKIIGGDSEKKDP